MIEDIIEFVKNSFSIKQVCIEHYNYCNAHTINKINKIIIDNNLDTSHFRRKNSKYEVLKKECPECKKKFETKKK